jgi:BirA family biotin operon repressor/biotin-[acetyl-CoA-carboxylase] ligase
VVTQEIDAALAASAGERGVFGRRWSWFDEVGSTNDIALRAAERGDPEGTVIVAGAQSAGRGRLGRTWHSPPGAGLYVSTIIRRPSVAPWVTLAGGVAVASGIRAATGLPVQIKWPNDVVAVSGAAFATRRKLAGILAEASTGAEGVQHIVLGFGINIRPSAFPPELQGRAGSLEGELGRAVEPAAVLAQILIALNRTMDQIERDGPPALLERWSALAPSATGAAIEWDGPDGRRRGVTAGIASDGALLARTDKTTERIIAGEVRWL